VGLPRPLVDQRNRQVHAILQGEDVKKQLHAIGMELEPTPADHRPGDRAACGVGEGCGTGAAIRAAKHRSAQPGESRRPPAAAKWNVDAAGKIGPCV
jgi:hypothetical protein